MWFYQGNIWEHLRNLMCTLNIPLVPSMLKVADWLVGVIGRTLFEGVDNSSLLVTFPWWVVVGAWEYGFSTGDCL